MQVSQEQIETIRQWAAQGDSLSVLQKRMENELGLRMTYMELRFFVDDHNIELGRPKEAQKDVVDAGEKETEDSDSEVEELLPAGVQVTLDRLMRPGAVVSGDVRFSDGVSAKWYLDQMGRLGLDCEDKEYRPSQEDVQEFQMELQNLLQKQGF